ncbi:hypothetical protein JOQ06_027383 [Pogonophryne albipinna]|uniref:PX domain-containing protein n=1 Tax=Pogonophryne albipinna TaxID=1090488 RepID=A0AAD6FMT4_9TELE|nr:hypothetical protein JOQ06_027383 [Pogonophryne albipinna]
MAGDQRVVISARIIGAVHRDTPKLKMFMISVLWSDNTEVIIYRSFQEFRKCHRQLKKRFPIMNIFKKNNRVLPKFRGQARKSSQKKGSKRSIQRMKFLESYCEKLLKCDQSVTRTPEVTQFFMPKDHDLQPDFTKNSILILMSDDLPNCEGGGEGSHQPTGSVTHPFVTQTYFCVAAYETKDTKNRPFKVAMGEKLDVLIKDPAGWWLVENDSKGLAWFPAPYLQLLDGEDEEDSGLQHAGDLYCAVRSYTTKQHDEVSVLHGGGAEEVLRWLVARQIQWQTGSPLASSQQSDCNIDLSLLDRRGSYTSDERSESASANAYRTSSVVPQVPARPKTEEILTRCSTMTRKAALANKIRLHSQPDTIHRR